MANYAAEHAIEPRDQGLTCPWYQDGCCAVHPVRPALCRLFGHVPQMTCCNGHNVNIGGALLRKWHEKIKGSTRWLHEVIPGWTVDRLDSDLKLRRLEFVSNMRKVNLDE